MLAAPKTGVWQRGRQGNSKLLVSQKTFTHY